MNQQEQNNYQYQDPYQGAYSSQFEDQYQTQYQSSYAPEKIVDVQQVMTRTFLGMFLLLVISAASAYYTLASGLFITLLYSSTTFTVVIIFEVLVALAATWAVNHNNFVLSAGLTVVYSISTGVTLSIVFIAYTTTSVTYIFVLSALLFLGIALFGAVTKKDLTGVGQVGLMMLWGLILMGLLNIFFQSDALSNGLAIVGLAVFIGLTAYDTQKIKRLAAQSSVQDGLSTNVLAVYGAFTLYLDFINIFLKLLRLFGKRR